jgi:hypothetical protein
MAGVIQLGLAVTGVEKKRCVRGGVTVNVTSMRNICLVVVFR